MSARLQMAQSELSLGRVTAAEQVEQQGMVAELHRLRQEVNVFRLRGAQSDEECRRARLLELQAESSVAALRQSKSSLEQRVQALWQAEMFATTDKSLHKWTSNGTDKRLSERFSERESCDGRACSAANRASVARSRVGTLQVA